MPGRETFTTTEALARGVTRRQLQGPRFVQVFRGVYIAAETPLDLTTRISAARRILPPDAAVSHFTNLRLRGFDIGPELPLHFSTNRSGEIDRPGLIVHRRNGLLHATDVHGVPALGAMRTFVDVATKLSDRNLLRVGDWLASTGQVHPGTLRAYVEDSHLNGVQRARRVARLVRAGVRSPRESEVRWALIRCGLPEPDINVDIHDDHGQWLACGDLVYTTWKVLVEYDGWQHERDARQRQWDHLRREALEAAGWRVIVVTTADMSRPDMIGWRVRQALRARGWVN